jgi:hypothetical protein
LIALVCEWGGDLTVGPSGDINIAPVEIELQQRVIRRLLTNSGDYIWHIEYGGGLGGYVGTPYDPNAIEGTTLRQLQYETLVTPSPAPKVLISQSLDGTFSATSVTVQYKTVGTSAGGMVVLGLGE